jgi:putative FmdB family regulatory protein
MAILDVIYRCLRCGHEYEGEYDSANGPQELSCPKCKSNSVRRIPKKDAAK